jgi:hypothetical protein
LGKISKATRFIEGKCVFENDAHTFIVESVPAGLARNLKRALKEHTGLTYKVRVRDVEGKSIADGDAEADLEEVASAGAMNPAAPSASATAADEMAHFTARFKALQPDILKAAATRTPQGDEIKRRAVEAGTLAGKKDFSNANQSLDAVESLLRKTHGPAVAGPALKPQPNGAFQSAWAAATTNLLEAVDRIQSQLAVFASMLMQSEDENLVWIAEEGLSQVFSSLRDSALTIQRATSKLPARVLFKAQPAIDRLKREITTPRVLACDENKLGVSVTIRDTISKAIQELEAALKLAKA